MQYISTRHGLNPEYLTFSEAVLQGLAKDGGLLLPAAFPILPDDLLIKGADLSLMDFAVKLMTPFIADDQWVKAADLPVFLQPSLEIFEQALERDLLQPIETNLYTLELFRGPTLSFKDIAMQFVAPLFEYLLFKKKTFVTLIVATSGDTGSGAIHAFKGKKNIQLVVFFPKNRVSPFQQHQMVSVKSSNIHSVAVRGTFDDCQSIVKSLFVDKSMLDYNFSAVNSINWGRILIQMVYHARAAMKLFQITGKKINIAVPTGNFGNMLAAYYCKQLGFPIGKLLVATNANDIMQRFINHNDLTRDKVVHNTISPSMDIQMPSNLERYLYQLFEYDADQLKQAMQEFHERGQFILPANLYRRLQCDFQAVMVKTADNVIGIKDFYNRYRSIAPAKRAFIDPHSAIAWLAVQQLKQQGKIDEDEIWLLLATASPAKFQTAIEKALINNDDFSLSRQELQKFFPEFSMPMIDSCPGIDNNIKAAKQFIQQNLPKQNIVRL